MKLGLGTVQFGLKYGIANKTGKPDNEAIRAILTRAEYQGIRLLDTAADYGDSESSLGEVLQPDSPFEITTKISKSAGINESLTNSLKKLSRTSVYGVFFHSFQQFQNNPYLWDQLVKKKEEKIVKKIGFSLYLPEELETLLSLQVPFDIVQIPYSILDQRFEQYFSELKSKQVEIHTRSSFVQGLVFADTETLSDFFAPIKPKLKKIVQLSKIYGRSVESLCLSFIDTNSYIDKIIIGVDTPENLDQNVAALRSELSEPEITELRNLREDNEQMILPYNWKMK